MEPAGDRPVLAEIVERHTGGNSNIATTTATSGDDSNGVLCTLRPIQAVVGRPFPRFHPDRFYGRQTMDERSRIGLTGTAGGATTAGPAHGFTAHVQPTTSNGAGNITGYIGMGSYDGTGVIASMARQHQWEAQEFEGLERGYYTVPLHPPSADGTTTAQELSEFVQGEAYVELLLRFLCSTVRKHRECATSALKARLMCDSKLRERCAFGPGCAQFVRLIITELSSGHKVPCGTAAECLVLLFYDATAEMVEVVGEIGVPPTDPAACMEEEGKEEDTTAAANNEVTFADLSEWMRGGEDKARALDQLGLTSSVMDALSLLPPTVVARLLLGSGVLSLPPVAVRVASDPRYTRFVTERLGSVLVGATPTGEIVEELLLLRRVLHVKQACSVLLPLLYESLVLFLRHMCTIPAEEMRSVSEVVASLAAFLVLRALVRHGRFGVFYDIWDALLTATGVGACMPAEMWLLLTSTTVPSEPTSSTIETCSLALARGAVQTLVTCAQAIEDRAVDEASAGYCASLLAAATSMHYLATYFTIAGETEETSLLLGSAGETLHRVQEMLAKFVLSSEGLRHAFIRLNNSREVGSSFTVHTQPLIAFHPQPFVESCWASLTHARVRLLASTHIAFSAVRPESSMGYAAALAIKFEQNCMGLSKLIGHLLPDEICTMIEVANFMRRHTHTLSVDQQQQYKRSTYIAEIFILHGIALTKHCLDAAQKIINSILGLPDDIELGATVQSSTSLPPTTLLRIELGKSLRRAVEQTQWPWFLFPLYDGELLSKSAWCAWLQQALGAHQCMKRLLEWDVILCHVLKWCVLHRETQRDWHSQIGGNENKSRGDNTDLFFVLEALYIGVLPRSGGVITASASDTLKALTAYASPHAEESMNRRLFEALAVTATACPPSVSVVMVRLMAHTILEGDDTQHRTSFQTAVADTTTAMDTNTRDDGDRVSTPSVSAESLLQSWAATGRLSDEAPRKGAVSWELENIVELLQVVAEKQAFFLRDGRLGSIIVRQLMEGMTRGYLQQHHPLTAFERQVLCRIQEEVAWCPTCLTEVLADPAGDPQTQQK
ncbi:hypothetical protein, conserved [Trypanosoma cruzi]|uniref:Uncharacterized protein n=2 Tax=Trypanosoma cruzi TaxID=5693 RepID=Q4DIU7_TRYCC|nr:hypothetical protein, conserved [Trypanosoma cruzi]EAN92440.1 hypothetical protein, conserved [Trypanosoma cruzi]|eukprot:XP_814291.1 hypothetical protein [Trypanosoma cruzi strain CL Brener]